MTVFGPVFRRGPPVPVTRERWELPDGDFVDVDRMDGPSGAPLLVALHGLEGSSSAHYIRGLLAQARARGWRGLALNFRGCSGDMNRLVRSYHSGETGDLDELVRRVRREADRIVIAGCSLGGNVLVKWLGEQGTAPPPQIRAAAALSVPFDLALCAQTLDSAGFWRWIYRTRFLRTLKRKSLEKLAGFPGAVDLERVRAARTLFEFDDALTARVHGFADAPDYYTQSSSGRFVAEVRVPLLLLSAEDDPFIPARCIPRVANPAVTLEVWPHGGHLGFVEGPPWRPRFYAERRAVEFLAQHVG
ncbi:MAG TPA: alpha/beta fold hydrolase [Myxococcales bacterium]|jgi:predicted alpha/beta-fold hydrolase|nr:alpha/beta fold hydrolase [Myxococcales bacterium]